MPTKYPQTLWEKTRERMNQLVDEGVSSRRAAMQVSREQGGKPAPGSIMNRFNHGWAPGGRADGELRIQLIRANDELRELQGLYQNAVKELETVQEENNRLQEENVQLREDRARAEGAMDVLEKVADLESGGSNNGDSHS